MEQLELLKVERTFFISRPGVQMLVLAPHFMMPRNWGERGWAQRQVQVEVLRPDGSRLPATAQINVTHVNIRDANVPIEARWPIKVWLTDRTEAEVPVGSRIMVDPEVPAAILGEDPAAP